MWRIDSVACLQLKLQQHANFVCFFYYFFLLYISIHELWKHEQKVLSKVRICTRLVRPLHQIQPASVSCDFHHMGQNGGKINRKASSFIIFGFYIE